MTFPNLFKKWSSSTNLIKTPHQIPRWRKDVSLAGPGSTHKVFCIDPAWISNYWLGPSPHPATVEIKEVLTQNQMVIFLGLLQASGRSLKKIMVLCSNIVFYKSMTTPTTFNTAIFKSPPPAVGSWLYWNGWCFCCWPQSIGTGPFL